MAIDPSVSTRINAVFKAQRDNRAALKLRTADERILRLQNLRAEIVRRTDDIDEALNTDLRKPRQGAANPEIAATLADIDSAIKQVASWMAPEPIEPSPHFSGNPVYIMYEPRGAVLLLGPWNFPFGLVFSPLIPMLAAGNSVIIKPNEMQPSVSRVIAEIIFAVFPENEVAVFEGGIPVAEALQELPFDHVFFTGSPAIGKRVMSAASKHLSSVTLELGGKCPAILDDSFKIMDAAGKIAGARFYNAGQLCLSVDHVWVPRARETELLQALSMAVDAMFFSDGKLCIDRLSRIVDARNFSRLKSYIDDAVATGAKIIRGGELDEASLTINPTILSGVSMDSQIMQHEIFGPILPVLVYDDLDDVIWKIDKTGKPLAMYIFSHDQSFVDKILNGTSSGGVTVNHVMLHAAESHLPFGGVNGSGMGRYKGIYGFRELSNARSIFVNTA